MIIFAALSNTLLITILISILSATYAKVDAHATEEYLFQSAIATLEGVKTDALFSYQPPFNLAAYAILAPLSCVLTPRMLHKVNVMLIRLTSVHILVTITVYERFFAPGSRFIETGKDKAYALFESLPRHIRNMSLLEAMVGASSHDLLDAIFDVELTDDVLDNLDDQPDEDGEAERDQVRSMASYEERSHSLEPGMRTPKTRGRYISGASMPASPGFSRRSASRNGAYLAPPDGNSPLAQLFSGPRLGAPMNPDVGNDIANGLKRVENLMETIPDIQKMRTELKDTKERLQRIETLLLSLTSR